MSDLTSAGIFNVTAVPSTLEAGGTYSISGTQWNRSRWTLSASPWQTQPQWVD